MNTNILRNNTLIAEFLGLELEETLQGEKVYAIKMPDYRDGLEHRFRTYWYSPEELRFHRDWNHLLIVVKAIKEKAEYESVYMNTDLTSRLDRNLSNLYFKGLYEECVLTIQLMNIIKGI